MNVNSHKTRRDLELAEAEQILRQASLDQIIASIRANRFTAQEIVERLARDAKRSSQDK